MRTRHPLDPEHLGQTDQPGTARVLKEGNTTGYLNIKADYGDSFRGEVQHFIDSIQNGTVPISTESRGSSRSCSAPRYKSPERSRGSFD